MSGQENSIEDNKGDEMLNDKEERQGEQAQHEQVNEPDPATEQKAAGTGETDGAGDETGESGHTEVLEPQPHEVLDPAEAVADSAGPAESGKAEAGKSEAGKPDTEVMAGLQREIASMHEQVLRTHAEMQNFRRRAEKDVANAHKFALEKFVADLVNVVDNLERAVTTIDPDNEACKALGEGVELTLKGFLDTLRRFNVEQVDPKGKSFNPELHQAMTMVPHPDLAPNTVIDVFQKGYLLNGRLVRPAMVVVSRSAGNSSGDGGGGQ